MAYVIKKWYANEVPNQNGVFVKIEGRKSGLISFLLSWIGIDPKVAMVADKDNIRFEEGSLFGYLRHVIPLEKLSFGSYGYTRPVKGAAIIALLGLGMATLGKWWILFSLVFFAAAALYYYLSKELLLSLHAGGKNFPIAFKSSLIEGVNIGESEAARVIHIIEMLLKHGAIPEHRKINAGEFANETLGKTTDAQTRPSTSTAAKAPVAPIFCAECGTKNDGDSQMCKSCGTALLIPA